MRQHQHLKTTVIKKIVNRPYLINIIFVFIPVLLKLVFDINVFFGLHFVGQIYYFLIIPLLMGIIIFKIERKIQERLIYILICFAILTLSDTLSRIVTGVHSPVDNESLIIDKLFYTKQYYIYLFFVLISFFSFKNSRIKKEIIDDDL